METQYNLSLLKLNIPVNQTNGTDCVDGVQWVYAVMGECCITAREQASAYLGVASLVLWGLVGFPQMCKNFCHIDGMAGLSFLLILQWAGGDLANLTGCLLTRQNNFQIILAGYFVGMDVLLLLQFLYYFCIHKKRRADLSEDRKDLIGRQKSPKPVLCLMGVFAISSFIGKHYMWSIFANTAENSIHPSHVSRSLLSVYEVDDVKDPLYWNNPRNVIGYLMGVVSAVFYLGSRVSQIYKNVKARSTEGLAFLTFTLAVFGNLTYGGQIVILDFSQDYIIEKLPWLLGSFGVVFLDCTILVQFVYYRKNNQIRTAEEEALLTGEYIINADDENSQDEQTENQHDIN